LSPDSRRVDAFVSSRITDARTRVTAPYCIQSGRRAAPVRPLAGVPPLNHVADSASRHTRRCQCALSVQTRHPAKARSHAVQQRAVHCVAWLGQAVVRERPRPRGLDQARPPQGGEMPKHSRLRQGEHLARCR